MKNRKSYHLKTTLFLYKMKLIYLSLLYTTHGFLSSNTNVFLPKYRNNQLTSKQFTPNNNDGDDEKSENKFDIIEGIGGFMGYPKERKWKGFRIACYSIFAGSILRSAVVDLGNYIDNKTTKESLEQYSNVVFLDDNKYLKSIFTNG